MNEARREVRGRSGVFAAVGAGTLARARGVAFITAMVVAALRLALRRRTWNATGRRAIAEQVFESGVRALGVVTLLAVLAGLLVVLQARLWLATIGQSSSVGQFLVVVLGRELAPLLVNLVLIARSGAPITAELAVMRITGKVRALDSRGLDPFAHLVAPRILALGISVLPLASFFLLGAHLSGWVAMALVADSPVSLFVHFEEVTRFSPLVSLQLTCKCLLPALVTGAICCHAAFTVGELSDIPGATRRALVRSLTAAFVLSAAVSALAYL